MGEYPRSMVFYESALGGIGMELTEVSKWVKRVDGRYSSVSLLLSLSIWGGLGLAAFTFKSVDGGILGYILAGIVGVVVSGGALVGSFVYEAKTIDGAIKDFEKAFPRGAPDHIKAVKSILEAHHKEMIDGGLTQAEVQRAQLKKTPSLCVYQHFTGGEYSVGIFNHQMDSNDDASSK